MNSLKNAKHSPEKSENSGKGRKMAKKKAKPEEKPVRRGNHEGTVYQRADGRWEAQISLGNRDGKRIRRSYTGRHGESKQEVLDQLHKLLHKRATATLAEPSKITLLEFLEHWLELGAGASVSPSTIDSYRRNLETHVFQVIGHIRAQQITPLHIQTVLSRMKVHRRAKKGRSVTAESSSERSKQYLFSILRKAFSRGIQWGILIRNPCEGCERPKTRKFEIAPLNEEQVRDFLKDVRVESGKVSWPTRAELRDSTIVVIVAVLLVSFFVGVVDFILQYVMRWVFR